MIRFSGFNCTYIVDGRVMELRSENLSEIDNEDLRLEFTLQDDAEARIYSVEAFPKRPLTWQRFEIAAATDYQDSPGSFATGSSPGQRPGSLVPANGCVRPVA